jgi:glycosyltransferase involved in cell wall biosynthesis
MEETIGSAGFVVDTVLEYADKISLFINNPDKCYYYSKCANMEAESRFSHEVNIKKIESIWKNITSN